jgi:hypothetical protein
LAKEVRYDQARRLSVVELVTISRSSADQRKGRAGRIAPGAFAVFDFSSLHIDISFIYIVCDAV